MAGRSMMIGCGQSGLWHVDFESRDFWNNDVLNSLKR